MPKLNLGHYTVKSKVFPKFPMKKDFIISM